MKTSQLIVLWYAGLCVVAVLAYQAANKNSANYLIAAIVVVASLLIYTLKPHPAARKRWVLLAVVGPIGAVAIAFYGILQYQERQQRMAETLIPLDQVELVDPKLTGDHRLVGRIRNLSSYTLTGLDVKILLYEKGEIIDSDMAHVSVEAPPGEERDFKAYTFFSKKPRPGVTWDYSVTKTRGAARR